jgi:hypothetical protein
LNGLADDRRITRVVPLPELIAEHHDAHGILAGWCVGRNQPPAEKRRRAPMIRRVGRDVRGDNVLRNIAIGRRQVPAVFANHAFDRSRLAQSFELRRARAGIADASSGVDERDLHHPLGPDVRERIEEDAVDDAEDGARRADAERE